MAAATSNLRRCRPSGDEWLNEPARHLSCCGSPEAPITAFIAEHKKLANELGLDIVVSHLPPGISKWNKIEHRLFSFISQNWCAQPLVSYRLIVELISATTTKTG